MQLEANTEYILRARDIYENFNEKVQECLSLNVGFAMFKLCILDKLLTSLCLITICKMGSKTASLQDLFKN